MLENRPVFQFKTYVTELLIEIFGIRGQEWIVTNAARFIEFNKKSLQQPLFKNM